MRFRARPETHLILARSNSTNVSIDWRLRNSTNALYPSLEGSIRSIEPYASRSITTLAKTTLLLQSMILTLELRQDRNNRLGKRYGHRMEHRNRLSRNRKDGLMEVCTKHRRTNRNNNVFHQSSCFLDHRIYYTLVLGGVNMLLESNKGVVFTQHLLLYSSSSVL